MSDNTAIEWTDATWNPIRGCSRVSEGCRHCYAERVAHRFGGPGKPYEGLTKITNGAAVWSGAIQFVVSHLLDPLKWKGKPIYDSAGNKVGHRRGMRVFVNSMSDLFHENVTDEMRDQIFATMALSPQHTFQVLTKRPERMLEYLSGDWGNRVAVLLVGWKLAGVVSGKQFFAKEHRLTTPLPNVQLGVSVEDQKTADERIPLLLQTPAAVRFISAEPLLRSISLVKYMAHWLCRCGAVAMPLTDDTTCACDRPYGDEWRRCTAAGLDWVICGGESGPGARPMYPGWARGLRDQSVAAGVPFFFKQWGEWTPGENVERTSGKVDTAKWFDGKWSFDRENLAYDEGHVEDEPDVYRVGKKTAGHLLDGVQWHQFPEAPKA